MRKVEVRKGGRWKVEGGSEEGGSRSDERSNIQERWSI